MVAPMYTLILTPNGSKMAWPPSKNDGYVYIINMHVCNTTNSLKYKKRRIRRRRIASTKEKPKKLGRMVATVHNFGPKILLAGSAKLRWAGLGQETFIASAVCMWSSGKKKSLAWAAQIRFRFHIFLKSSEAAMGGGGARSAPFGMAMS